MSRNHNLPDRVAFIRNGKLDNRTIPIMSSFKVDKENRPSSSLQSADGRPLVPMDVNSVISNPSSPTIQGLIELNGTNVNMGIKSNNLNVKVCNCRDKWLCDHNAVSFLTKNKTIESNGGRSNGTLPDDSKQINDLCNGNKLVYSKTDTGENMPSFPLNYRNPQDINLSSQNSRTEPSSASTSPCNKQRRWQLESKRLEENLSDMGVSLLPSEPIDVDEASTSSCCDGSVICHNDMADSEFFVYKKRRLESPTAPNYFELLQDEIILDIFQWLPKSTLVKCAQTCKRFQKIALDYTLWRRLDVSCRYLRSGTLGRIVLRGCQFLRLSRTELPGAVFSPSLQYLPPFQSSLAFVDLSMAVCEPSSLVELLSVCVKLRKISLEFLTVTDAVLEKLAQNKQLDTVNMCMCSGLTQRGLAILFAGCPGIQQLNLAWTGLSRQTLHSTIPLMPMGMQKLNLAGFRDFLRDDNVLQICQRMQQLQALDLSDNTDLTEVSVKYIAHSLPQLRSLNFSRCYGIFTDTLVQLCRLPNLGQMSLFGLLSYGTDGHTTVKAVLPNVAFNRQLFSAIARPTVGLRRTSIWLAKVRDT